MPLPINSTLDPYTQVYNLMCNYLRASVAVRRIVTREKNIVALSEGKGQDQIRDVVKDVDLPEILIKASNVAGNLNIASNSAEVIRSYRLFISTGTGKITETIFPLEWAVTCALSVFSFESALRALTWNGAQFVKAVKFDGADSGESEPTVNRGIQGWAAVWRMTVQMSFSHVGMKDFNTTGELNAP